jgi:hypothetical protein
VDDTSDEAAAVHAEVLRRMGPERRMLLCFQMSEEVRELAIQGELHRHPELSYAEAKLEVIRRMYGDELFTLAYGPRIRRAGE